MSHDHFSRRAPSNFETLEPRRLLSASVADEDPNVTPITWHGQEAYAVEGQWLAQFGGVTGSPAEQVDAVRQRITGTGLALDVAKHLGSDGLVLLCAPGSRFRVPQWGAGGRRGDPVR